MTERKQTLVEVERVLKVASNAALSAQHSLLERVVEMHRRP